MSDILAHLMCVVKRMGTCIGKRNFSSFMTFNLTWLFYFLYAIIWVTFIGASFYEPHLGANSSSDY